MSCGRLPNSNYRKRSAGSSGVRPNDDDIMLIPNLGVRGGEDDPSDDEEPTEIPLPGPGDEVELPGPIDDSPGLPKPMPKPSRKINWVAVAIIVVLVVLIIVLAMKYYRERNSVTEFGQYGGSFFSGTNAMAPVIGANQLNIPAISLSIPFN